MEGTSYSLLSLKYALIVYFLILKPSNFLYFYFFLSMFMVMSEAKHVAPLLYLIFLTHIMLRATGTKCEFVWIRFSFEKSSGGPIDLTVLEISPCKKITGRPLSK